MTTEEEHDFNLLLTMSLQGINCNAIILKNHVRALENIEILMDLFTIADYHEVESILRSHSKPSFRRWIKELILPQFFKLDNMVENSRNIFLATNDKQDSDAVHHLKDILTNLLKRIRLLDELESKFMTCLYLINTISKNGLPRVYLYLIKNHKKDYYDSLKEAIKKQKASDKENGLGNRDLADLLHKFCLSMFSKEEVEILEDHCYKLKKQMLIKEFNYILNKHLI